MKEKSILFILWLCLFFGWYNKIIRFIARQSKNKNNFGFIGCLAGGNLEYPEYIFKRDILDESFCQLKHDLENKNFQDELWH